MRSFFGFCARAVAIILTIVDVFARANDILDAGVQILILFGLYLGERALRPKVDRLFRKSFGFAWMLATSHTFCRELEPDELRDLRSSIYGEVVSEYPYRMVAKERTRRWRYTIISGVTRLRVDLRWRSETLADVLVSRHVPLMSAIMFVVWVVLIMAHVSENSQFAERTLNALIVLWLSSLVFSVLLGRWSTLRFSNASMHALADRIEEACRKVDARPPMPSTPVHSVHSKASRAKVAGTRGGSKLATAV